MYKAVLKRFFSELFYNIPNFIIAILNYSTGIIEVRGLTLHLSEHPVRFRHSFIPSVMSTKAA